MSKYSLPIRLRPDLTLLQLLSRGMLYDRYGCTPDIRVTFQKGRVTQRLHCGLLPAVRHADPINITLGIRPTGLA
jgi:hypothetical protein